MNYEGLFIGGEGTGNPPINLEGAMIYKNDWQINTLYEKDQVVIYFEIQYIAIRENINKEPDNNPDDWSVLAYWSNNNNVSNYRGTFIQDLVLKQYDSVYDRITNGVYTNQNPTNYVCTTQPDLITDLHKINNQNALLPAMFSQPYMFASLGNSTNFNSGQRYAWTLGQPNRLFTYPYLSNFRSRGWKRTGIDQRGSNFMLDPSSIYAKEGVYRFTAIVNYWMSSQPIRDSRTLQSDNTGSLQIEEAPAVVAEQIIDVCGFNSPISQPQGNPNFYGNQSTLTGLRDVRFGKEYGFKLHNIIYESYTWSFAIRLSIEYMGPSDPIDLRYNYNAISRGQSPVINIPNSIIEIMPTPVQTEYEIPFPLVNNLLATSINTTIVDTPSNEYTITTDYAPKCIQLNGYPATQQYTLSLTGRIGLTYNMVDLQEIRVCFQSSPNNIDWVDISKRQLIYLDDQMPPGTVSILNIPFFIQHEGYQPDVQFEQQYIRAIIIPIPKPNRQSVSITLEANGGNDFSQTGLCPLNSVFQIFPNNEQLSSLVYYQTCETVRTYFQYDIPSLGSNPRQRYILPSIFAFLPVVMNTYDNPNFLCKSVNNQEIIYSVPDNLYNDYGPKWVGVPVYTDGIYNFDYNLNILMRRNNLISGVQYNLEIYRGFDNAHLLYTQRLTDPIPILGGLYINQRITTALTLEAGWFIYPVLTWSNLAVGIRRLEIFTENSFSLTPRV